MRNVVAGCRLMLRRGFGSCLFNNVSFISYFLTLTPVNGFAELSATLVSELGSHVGIHFILSELGLNYNIYLLLRLFPPDGISGPKS